MIINTAKTKEIAFRRITPSLTLDLCHILGVEHVREA